MVLIQKDKNKKKEKQSQKNKTGFFDLIGRAKKYMRSPNLDVLILGETGTGKTRLAREIHKLSERKGAFIEVSGPELVSSLFQSTLFGHEKGSFTGADEKRVGKFELANHGTLFIDEIADISLEDQAKLLRAIQEKTIERIGGSNSIKLEIKFIFATHKNLEKMIEAGTFRNDLFQRVRSGVIDLPPLRKQKSEILRLAREFVEKFSGLENKKIIGLTKDAEQKLMKYSYPGNIRELEKIILRAVVCAEGEVILADNIQIEENNHIEIEEFSGQDNNLVNFLNSCLSGNSIGEALKIVEKIMIESTLKIAPNRKFAAKRLGISEVTLWRRIQFLDISKPLCG